VEVIEKNNNIENITKSSYILHIPIRSPHWIDFHKIWHRDSYLCFCWLAEELWLYRVVKICPFTCARL